MPPRPLILLGTALRLFAAAAVLLLGTATAQRCVEELREAANRLPPETPSGVVAVDLTAAAVRLMEPALPALAWSAEIPLEPGEVGYDSARYLSERLLLPQDWQPEEIGAQTWAQLLSSFLAWYALPPVTAAELAGPADPVADLAMVLERISREVRPLLLVASRAEDRNRVAFLGLVWNWTVYPRLIVMRPGEEQSLRRGVAPLLDELSNCAVDLHHYVLAPEQTARRLFLTHSDARMYVIGSQPERRNAWPLLVPEGAEEEFFAFAAGDVADLAAYAAAFDGGEIGVGTLMGMLPRLRTNVPPYRIPGILRTPVTN